MNREKFILQQRTRRERRIRKTLRGTAGRPRLSVFRSHTSISCQIIDDAAHRTLVSASSREVQLREEVGYGGNAKAAAAVGRIAAERALAAGIKAVRFDRGHWRYHGRVAALANAAREAGLSF